MGFEVIEEISDAVTFSVGSSIRELGRLKRAYGK